MSQEDLAERVNISVQELRMIESSAQRVPPDLLVRFANVQGVPVAYYFTENGDTDGEEAAPKGSD